MTYRINPDEMSAHAKKLDDIGERVSTAMGAGQATSHPEAFGLLGFQLMGICAGAQHMAMNTLKEAVDAATDHVKRVQSWREHIQTNDEAQADMFTRTYR
jgi:translation elongation factor EF-1beta